MLKGIITHICSTNRFMVLTSNGESFYSFSCFDIPNQDLAFMYNLSDVNFDINEMGDAININIISL